MACPKKITIDGVDFVREDSVQIAPTGPRAVVVVDRGWIFAGDVTEKDGKILLSRAVNVRCWSSLGFEGMLANPKSDKVTLKKMPFPVEIPEGSEIFRVPVPEDWGP